MITLAAITYLNSVVCMEFKSEKEKLQFQHRQDLRKLVVDKLLIGIILIVLGFIVNMLLENYKSDSIRDRFLLEKKLEAIQKISNAYMEMNNAFDSATLAETLSAEDHANLDGVVQHYISEWTNWAVILSTSYRKQLDYITWLYLGMASYELTQMRAYREYQLQLFVTFNYISQQELGLVESAPPDRIHFVEWSIQQANERGSREFLAVNFDRWKKRETAKP